jgi:nucleotide-binding universal stress UspA family protein
MRILVGVDGSENGQAALDFASDEARLRGASLRVICAWELPTEGWGEIPPPEEAVERVRQNAEDIVHAAARRARENTPGLEVEPVAVEGRPANAILDHAADADMIVVGSRGHTGFTGLLVGSVSQRVVQHARVPVVVVPRPDDSG